MQLSLSATLAPRPAGAAAARLTPAPWRDSAISQLDAIEAANQRGAGSLAGNRQTWIALGAGALLLLIVASVSPRAPAEETRRATAPATLAPAPVLPSAPSPTVATPAESIPDTARVAEPAAAPVPSADEAERKQRARQLADAHRKAAQLAQERAWMEAQRAQAQQQRDAERAQGAAEPVRAREAPPEAAAVVASAREARRSVRESCASAGNFFSEQFCQARECRKADQHADPVCTRLRDIEEVRQRASAER